MKYVKFLISTITLISSSLAAPTAARCGKDFGYCPQGQCCNSEGYCGTSLEHCSVMNGCQIDFGDCRCGVIDGNEYGVCAPNYCCGKDGYCGITVDFCNEKNGCQSEFGKCSKTSIVEVRCGAEYGYCPLGQCCNKDGYCGSTVGFCSLMNGCQSEFGACFSDIELELNTDVNSKNMNGFGFNFGNNKNNNYWGKNKKNGNKNKNKDNYKSTNNNNNNKSNNNNNNKTSNTNNNNSQPIGENTRWAGFRYSPYGLEESFGYVPDGNSWDKYIKAMRSNVANNVKTAMILIVGTESKTKYCDFGFPKPSSGVSSSLNVKFSSTDEYEDILKKCDQEGIDVWLQVEAGENDLVDLANIVLDKYGHHSSVKGFGIDCEWWYRNYNSNGHGRPLTDSDAEKVVKAVRAKNPNYTVFAKHWDPKYMPSNYRDGMIFVNDSQEFDDLDEMKEEFGEWAEKFNGNPVMFQIGYNADKSIWKDDPMKVVKAIEDEALKYNKQVGVIWVDFTLKKAFEKLI